jgi:hypothetical protein
LRASEDGEHLARGERHRGELVGDVDDFVGIGSLIARCADGGGDAVNRHRAIGIDDAGDIAQPVRRSGEIISHSVIHPQPEAVLKGIIEHPLSGCIVEAPLLEPGGGVFAGIGRDAVALVRNVERGRIGEESAERVKAIGEGWWKRSRFGVGEEARKTRQRRNLRIGRSGPRGQPAAWNSHLVNRIYAVAAAALCHIKRVVENRRAAEIVVLAGFIRRAIRQAGLRVGQCNREAVLKPVRGPRHSLLLPHNRGLGVIAARRCQLHAGVVDDIGWRRRTAVAGIADQQILASPGAVDIVCQNDRATIVAAIGIGVGHLHAAVQIYLHDRAVGRGLRVGIGRIDMIGYIGIRHVEGTHSPRNCTPETSRRCGSSTD